MLEFETNISKMLIKESLEIHDTIVNYRRKLHQNPEVGFDLSDTISLVKKELLNMGINPIDCGKAGVTASIGGKKSGKVFLLRADMDALPIKEETNEIFASNNGNMHACGHDLHTAMLLGTARLLKAHENEIQGTIKLMFQPAEEIFEGANDMIKSGVLENPKVDVALMIHVMAGMPFPVGTVIVCAPGVSAPSADCFEIKIQGKGCHGSMPNVGVDPITVASHIVINLQEIHARELSLDDRVVLTIGTINAGTVSNVIPNTAIMSGSIRTFDDTTRDFIKQRMVEISKGTSEIFRAEASVTFGNSCPTLVNDEDLCECIHKYVKELLGKEKVFSADEMSAMMNSNQSSKTAGSEDFAYISHKVPSIMLALASGQPENGYNYPQHHPMVRFDENVLSSGSAVYAYTALRWLQEHQ